MAVCPVMITAFYPLRPLSSQYACYLCNMATVQPCSCDGCHLSNTTAVQPRQLLSSQHGHCPAKIAAIYPTFLLFGKGGCYLPRMFAVPEIWLLSIQYGRCPVKMAAIYLIQLLCNQDGCCLPNMSIVEPRWLLFTNHVCCLAKLAVIYPRWLLCSRLTRQLLCESISTKQKILIFAVTCAQKTIHLFKNFTIFCSVCFELSF